MKKIYYILIFLFLLSCSKDEIDIIVDEPLVGTVVSTIFDKEENIVTNEMELVFDIPSEGIYYLVITQKGLVITKEKFYKKAGSTFHTLYTSSMINGEYSLILWNENKEELNKTIIIIK